MGKVFVPSELAHSVLQRLRRANAGLEEMKHGNIQRECREEVCTYEEAREAFENDEKTRRFWEEYVREASPSTGLGVGGVQSLYLILPLLGGLLLIAVVMVAVWRCHSRKVFEGRSAFGHPHQDPSLPREGVDQQGRSYHPNLTPPLGLSPHNSPIHRGSELASGRADGGEPPPSYEEAVGQTDVRVHVDPPPQYEEIINSASIAGK